MVWVAGLTLHGVFTREKVNPPARVTQQQQRQRPFILVFPYEYMVLPKTNKKNDVHNNNTAKKNR